MLNLSLTQPDLLRALGSAGHGARVLIADGNYPHSTGSPHTASKVFLNVRPGLLTVTQVLEVLVTAINIEAATVMEPADGPDPEPFGVYRDLLGGLELDRLGRMDFYDAARSADVAVVIATGDLQHYSNLLLTIGTV